MTIPRAASAGALLLVLLCGCAPSTPSAPTPSVSRDGCPLTVSDAWAKASDSGMTAAFGRLDNPTGGAVSIVSATSPAAATVQLHEVLVGADGSSTMAPKAGGFVVPAGGSLTLAPGGDHLMLMDLVAPVRAGDDVALQLVTDTGARCAVTASARTFAGAGETYAPTPMATSMEMPTP